MAAWRTASRAGMGIPTEYPSYRAERPKGDSRKSTPKGRLKICAERRRDVLRHARVWEFLGNIQHTSPSACKATRKSRLSIPSGGTLLANFCQQSLERIVGSSFPTRERLARTHTRRDLVWEFQWNINIPISTRRVLTSRLVPGSPDFQDSHESGSSKTLMSLERRLVYLTALAQCRSPTATHKW